MTDLAAPPVNLDAMASYIASELSFDEYQRIKPLLAECYRLRAVLEDMRKRGLRFDLNPTHDLRYASTLEGKNASIWWHDYIKRMDDSVRERAASALNPSS